MTEAPLDLGYDRANMRPNLHSTVRSTTAVLFDKSRQPKNGEDDQRPDLKILFANKFFFRNGGSEAVMFDEMELLRRRNVGVVEFSMADERNVPSEYESYFVSQKSYRHVFASRQGQVGDLARSFPGSGCKDRQTYRGREA